MKYQFISNDDTKIFKHFINTKSTETYKI